MDYFDRVCSRSGVVILTRDEAVADIWANRHNLYAPHKAGLARMVNTAFYELVKSLATGRQYSTDELRTTAYWQAIKTYHKSWQHEPLSERADRQMRHRCRDGINLFYDIQKRGMLDPLDVIVEKMRMCLYRGNRRLQILKALGVKTTKVRYAIG